jgi:hypothetical protein
LHAIAGIARESDDYSLGFRVGGRLPGGQFTRGGSHCPSCLFLFVAAN